MKKITIKLVLNGLTKTVFYKGDEFYIIIDQGLITVRSSEGIQGVFPPDTVVSVGKEKVE